MKQIYKVDGPTLHFPDTTTVDLQNVIIDLGSCMVRGDVAITYLRHTMTIESCERCPHPCPICRSKENVES